MIYLDYNATTPLDPRVADAMAPYLREHHGNVEPDAAFAARVAARLPQGSAEVLGWAASRLLPATLALALVLAWFALGAAPVQPTANEDSAPTDDLVGWVLERSGEQP